MYRKYAEKYKQKRYATTIVECSCIFLAIVAFSLLAECWLFETSDGCAKQKRG